MQIYRFGIEFPICTIFIIEGKGQEAGSGEQDSAVCGVRGAAQGARERSPPGGPSVKK